MDFKFAILGFLSWKAFSGYEIKKMITESPGFYWSANNNQIYTSLVQLHRDDLVSGEVQQQAHYPARKVYSITSKGLAELKQWVMSAPDVPQIKKTFLVQLAWADQLEPAELESLIAGYDYQVQMQLAMLREKSRRGSQVNPARTLREQYIWEMLSENYARAYETELTWIQELRKGLKEK